MRVVVAEAAEAELTSMVVMPMVATPVEVEQRNLPMPYAV
jgi:hypothetical protein